MSIRRNAEIEMYCPWLSETDGTRLIGCIRERCPYYDLDIRAVVLDTTGGTESYESQSCIRVQQQSVELEIVADIFRELKKLLKEEKK